VYKVHVTLDDKHVPGSVFTVVVEEDLSIGGSMLIINHLPCSSSSSSLQLYWL